MTADEYDDLSGAAAMPIFIGGPAHGKECVVSARFAVILVPEGDSRVPYELVRFTLPPRSYLFFCWQNASEDERCRLVEEFLCA